MLTEARQHFLVDLQGCDGGLSLLPSPPTLPKEHRFQGGLIYSPMIEVEARVLEPISLEGRRMRIWLSQLQPWHFSRGKLPYIGEVYDRTGELPGGGLEAMLHLPSDTWLPAVQCLNTIWRRLSLTGVHGDGRGMTVVDFSFTADASVAEPSS